MTIIPTPIPWTRSNAKHIRAKVWTHYGITKELAHVTSNGTVYIFDECASHWTTCHNLNRRAQLRISAKPLDIH